jgi:hypothetical protein
MDHDFEKLFKMKMEELQPLALAASMQQIEKLTERVSMLGGALQTVIKFLGEDKLAQYAEELRKNEKDCDHKGCDHDESKLRKKAEQAFEIVMQAFSKRGAQPPPDAN